MAMQGWKKKYRTGLALIIVLIIIATISAFYYNSRNYDYGQIEYAADYTRHVESEAEKVARPTDADYKYYLKSIDGKIGIYEKGKDNPFQILSVFLDSLPAADRMALINGIRIYDDAALSKAIEDFES